MPLPSLARQAILEAIAANDVDDLFAGLPWDVAGEIHQEDLYGCLNDADKIGVAETCILALESANATHHTVQTLLDLLFSPGPLATKPPLKIGDLPPLQARAVRAMARAMEGGRQIFYGFFPQWGLPATMREWKDLAVGREPAPIRNPRPTNAGE